MKNSKAISGTELVERVLGGPDVDHLLETFKNKEHAVLEFKASWKPCRGDDASEDDCRWNVIKAIIAMANASGGCVILGIAENRSAVARKGLGTLLPGAFDPDGILEDPKREDKDLIAHTLSELFKGDGLFSIKANSGRRERLKVEHLDELRALVEPVEVCDCKAISGKVLVLIVHPCEDGNFLFVEQLPESRIGNPNPKKVLFYRDADLPKTHRIDDIEEMAKYCGKRKIEQPKYTRILKVAESKPKRLWKTLARLAFFALLATTALVGVQKHYKNKADMEKQAREEAQRKAEKEQQAREEAQRKAEDAQREAEEAQRKLEEAKAQYEDSQKRMEKLQASQDSSQKDLEEARAKLEEATKQKSSIELALASAKQLAHEMKDKADSAMALYQRHSEEQKLWESYCGHVKDKQANYSKDVKNLRDDFTTGLKTKSKSVSSAFDDARCQVATITNALSREMILNLVHEAAKDRQNNKSNDNLLKFIDSDIIHQFQKSCVNACKKFVDDGKEYEGELFKCFNGFKDSDLQKFPENLPEEWKNGIAKQIASVVAPPSYFPQKVFEKDNERIIKTSEAIARIVLKEGRKEIDFMVKHPDKWRKTDVSKLQKKLAIAVAKELNSIIDALQRDAVKHVSDAAEAACDAYLKAGKDLAKTVTRKDD